MLGGNNNCLARSVHLAEFRDRAKMNIDKDAGWNVQGQQERGCIEAIDAILIDDGWIIWLCALPQRK